jgi:hypothetical protein
VCICSRSKQITGLFRVFPRKDLWGHRGALDLPIGIRYLRKSRHRKQVDTLSCEARALANYLGQDRGERDSILG